ncbi:MAG: hypothetical protein HY847_01045 [Betaproteobacteria bacterium]|nr:hypothetical protein [Betaproteobacteria bacterium]
MNLFEHEESPRGLGDFRFNAIKHTPPALTPYAFKRPLPLLDELPSSIKLVLFSAPAGFGKTTSMLQWLQRLNTHGINTGWLTLDSDDNDIGRFIGHTLVALNSCNRESDQGNSASQCVVQGAHLGSLFDAIDNLALTGKPFTLFLDDYEFIANRAVHNIVNQLIGRMPTRCRLVIGTRVTPPLGIGKLRAREQLFEIGADLLCFSLEDAKHYLTEIRGLQLSDRALAELHSSTEGWAAAIQLASLAMTGQQNLEKVVRNFSGNQSAIADYLAEDVLNRQSDEIQDFLLKTSILDNLNPDICNALTGRSDSGALLNQIEKANLFLTAFGDDDNSSRYHNLFLSFLRFQLKQRHSEAIADLHDRASQWYLSQGFLVKALEHAFSAGNQTLAVSLLDQVANSLLDGGQVATLIRYVKMLPKECISESFRTRITYIWALIFSHCYQEAKQELVSLSHHEGNMSDIFRDEFLTLGPCLLLWTDHIDECILLAQESLPKLSKDSHFSSGALLNIFTLCLTTQQDRFSEVTELSDSAKNHMAFVNRELGLLHAEPINATSPFTAGRLRSARVGLVYSRCVDGIISFSLGRLRAAKERFETAFRFASQRNRYSSASAVAAIYLAETWYEENNLVAADEMLREYLTLIRQTGLADHIISAHRILCRIAITQDKLAEAHFQIREMESLGLERGLGRVVSSARFEKVRIALIQGDLETAEHILRQEETAKEWTKAISGMPHANQLDDSKLFRIRLLLKRGESDAALHALQQELQSATQAVPSRRGLLLKLLLAAARHLSGDETAARKSVAEVLEFVAMEGNKRLLADECYLLDDLFRTLINKGMQLTSEAELILKELASDAGSNENVAEAEISPSAQSAVDELTRRELQVLTLVAEGLTNRDMANKLFLSEVTIKTHMRNISSKLGVHNRTQAIIIARKRNLINS